ncbi:MAG: TRAP transporter substrate-binding protein [Oscillospiraceae bacterium]|nr:TRAP transporter substrate-binding protein [Oscillospiraceae bacterium]
MKKFIALLMALVMCFGLVACGGGSDDKAADTQEVIKIQIGHSDTTENLIHKSLENFAAEVNKRTEGRVEIKIYAAEQLGPNSEMIEMVKMGTLDAMMLPSGQQANYCPKFTALSLPFLFSDYEHVYKVLDGEIGQELLEGLEENNMIQLAYWENGLRQFSNSKVDIKHPSDMAGLKFRTPEDKMTIAIFDAYGASASPFAFSELYLALQQGTFDGQENPVANIHANNFQDVQKYLTMVNYQYQPKDMIFSLTTWNKLPADVQEVLKECAKIYGDEHRKAIVDNEASMLADLEAAGMVITYPDVQPFIDAAQPVYEDFYAANDWAEDLVNRINALK